jgi:hypothetical protein
MAIAATAYEGHRDDWCAQVSRTFPELRAARIIEEGLDLFILIDSDVYFPMRLHFLTLLAEIEGFAPPEVTKVSTSPALKQPECLSGAF